ncbi:MAG: metal ABC transporter substrate-binding protein [Campylobacterota bacterium]|nr:metal ABC transporter substrate-binding protein [Campylobacterota bacterium]
MKDFRNIIFVLIILLFALQMLVTKQDAPKASTASEIKPIISLSTFSLYDIAKHLVGDSVELVMILPFGVDAHSFEPTPKLMAKIQKSALVVYSGAGLEPWIDGFDFKSDVINMSKHVKLKELESKGHKHHEHHGESCSHSGVDPHYWLDIQNMVKSTNIIKDALIKISPNLKELYENNAQKYITMLKLLDSEYKNELDECKLDTIIVNHNAFSYLSHNYGFHVEALSGLSPEAQPSAKQMIKLTQHVKEHNIKTIFFESFVSDKAIKSIASEAKVNVDVLQPLGNITADEAKKKLTYEDIMRKNLEKISKALECK